MQGPWWATRGRLHIPTACTIEGHAQDAINVALRSLDWTKSSYRAYEQVRARQPSNWIQGDHMPSDLWSPTGPHSPKSENEVVATSRAIGSIPVRQNTTIAHLPMELVLCIIEQMDHRSLQNVSLLNKSFRQIANSLLFQTVQFKRSFAHSCREPPTAMFLHTQSIQYVAPWCSELGTFHQKWKAHISLG